ncbi:MAG TPA: A/G-specific adenine glycosylase [Terriglobales bacterium]|nr:A/G-specific adenine glycosylase [Terriglobales bacterium]
MTPARLRSLRRDLLRWYDRNRRDLPWRRDCDPYRVWVSEIMLQQTRVAAVLDHYARFLRRFPTVQSLAAAREASVLTLWSGLGYYHRARRMHQAARVIVRERSGKFPRTAEGWSTLPGIGRYTAAAIASIAFGEPVAVVDGNVERVLERLGIHGTQASPTDGRTLRQARGRDGGAATRESTWQLAQALLDRKRPGDFNQATMELGATVCTPRAPQCLVCPLQRFCTYRGADPPREQAARNRKDVRYSLARNGSTVLLVRRALDSSLMPGMWELPSLDQDSINGDAPLLRLRHSITDTDYRVVVFARELDQLLPVDSARWVTRRQWEQLPLTGLTRKVLLRLSAESGGSRGESKCR